MRSPPCALSQISGWRDRRLYPLARGCRAPRRNLPDPWTGRLPISVWRIRLAAAAELWGQRRRRRAGNTAVRSPPCALSQISGWRDRRLYPLARGCRAPRRNLPDPWTGRLPISVWRIRLAAAAELWGQRRRRRAGNTAVRSPPCALSQISGWRDRRLYPLARGCRAPRRNLPDPWTGRLPISVWRIRLAAAAELWGQRRRRRAGNTAVRSPPCALSQISGWRDRRLYPLARGCRAPRRNNRKQGDC